MEQHPVLRDATSPVLRLLRRLCAAAPGADEFVALLWRIWRWLCARRHGAAPATVGVTLPLDGCSKAALGVDEDDGGSSIKNRVTDDDDEYDSAGSIKNRVTDDDDEDDGGGSIKNRVTDDDGGGSIKNRVTDDDGGGSIKNRVTDDDEEDDGGGSIKNRVTDDDEEEDGGGSIKNQVTDDDEEDDGGGSIKNRVTDDDEEDDGGGSMKNRVTDDDDEDDGGGSIKNRVTDDDGEDDDGGSSIKNRVSDDDEEEDGGGSIKNRVTDQDDAGKNKRRLGIERPTPAADPGDNVPSNLLQDADLAGAATDPDDFPSELLRDADLAGPAALGIISKDKKAGKECALGTFKSTMIPVQKPPALAPWGSTPTPPAGRAPRAVEEEEEERRAMHLKYVEICSSLKGKKTYCFSCFMENEIDPAKKGKKPAKIEKNKGEANKHMDAWHKSNSIAIKCGKTGCFAMSRIRQDISHHEKYAHGL